MSDLKSKTISGLFWSVFQGFGARGIQFVVMLFLARILSPRDFGLVGMLAIFIAISHAVVESGFKQALIQKKEADNLDFSSVFYTNLLLGIGIYALLYVSSPWIAVWYETPQIKSLLRVLSLVFVFNAFSLIQETKLTKELDFKRIFYADLPANILSGIISVWMAFTGWGVWSIVAFQVLNRLFYSIQIWIQSKWKPIFRYSIKRIRELFAFGGNLLVLGILHSIYLNIYQLIIGKYFNVTQAGYYHQSNQLINYPARTLSQALGRVSFSTFSELQEDKLRMKNAYKSIMQSTFLVITPFFLIGFICAEPLIEFVFTAKWLPAVPYFRILCLSAILLPLNSFNINIIKACGRSDLSLKLGLFKKGISFVLLIAMIPFGVYYIVLSQLISVIIAFIINSYMAGRFIDYGLLNQINDLLRISIANIVAFVISILFLYVLSGFTYLIQIIAPIISYLLLYILCSRIMNLPGVDKITEIIQDQIDKRWV